MSAPVSLNDPEPDHGFQIAPMVDIVFVLLLFFMALAGLRQVEGHLHARLPGGEGDAIPLVIDIAADGTIQCNGLSLVHGDRLDVIALDVWLKEVADVDPGTTVLIRPAADAQHGRFIQVLAAVQQVGLRKITFA